MPPKIVIQVVVAVAIAVLLMLSAIRGLPETATDWLAPLGPATAIAYGGLLAVDRWLWRVAPLRWWIKRPNLHGTWHGSLHSQWVDPKTSERIKPDNSVFLVVRQRLWSVSARLLTAESQSQSLTAGIESDRDGVAHLHYLYMNTPRTEVRHRSDIHLGAVVIDAPQSTAAGLSGHYFADRHPVMTRGELHLKRRYRSPVESHAAGERLVSEGESSAWDAVRFWRNT